MRSENDKKYIITLAKAVECPPENLRAILGIDEFKSLLKALKPQHFMPTHAAYCANFHTHTVFSDGKATPQEILDEAQRRAEKNNRTFFVGINDHDTLESAKEVVRILAKNFRKYSKIRVVIGVEPCFKYDNNKILKMPIPFDALIYCFNPFDNRVNSMFLDCTSKNIACAQYVFEQASKKWNIKANYEDSCKFHCLLKTGGSSGYFKFSRLYIESLLKEANLNVPREQVFEMFKPYCRNQNGRLTGYTADIAEAIDIIAQSGFGEIGLAHPALVEINPKFENGYNFSTTDNLQDSITYNQALSTFIQTCGLKIIELNYQYPEKMFKQYPELREILDIVNSTCSNLNILKSGGTDSHGGNADHILEGRF